MTKIIIFLALSFLWLNELKGQDSIIGAGEFRHTVSDSLLTIFYNRIYGSFYNPSYMTTTSSTFTMLKVDIDKNGKVTGINFSDSASPEFVKAYLNAKRSYDDKNILEKYAKLKSYRDISLMIPVSFEPKYPRQTKIFNYDELEGMVKFSEKEFVGKAVFLSPIYIKVAETGNM